MSKFFSEQDHDEMVANQAREKAEAEAAKEAKWRADREAERKALIAKRLPFYKHIAEAVKKGEPVDGRPHVALVNEDDGSFVIDGVSVAHHIDIREEYSRGIGRFGYGAKQTGRLRLSIGGIGDRKSFPQKSDGSFSYDKIATELIWIANKVNGDRRVKNTQQSNEPVITALRAKLGYSQYDYGKPDLSASSHETKPVFFKFSIERAMTVDEATKLYRVLDEAGLIRK